MFSQYSSIVFNGRAGYNETMNSKIIKKTNKNLVPDKVNPSPDYYCTWQTQLYATCDGKPAGQRAIIGEKGMFSKEKPFGWAYFYENAREDLYFVMDDSWDVPLEDDPAYYGSLLLNQEKFPASYAKTQDPTEALKTLTRRMKELGWKGLGGWVCAQESERFLKGRTPEEYWKDQLTAAHEAGFSYWKVDWGKKDTDLTFRRMLTDLGRQYAPGLIIEHAKCPEAVPYGDSYRTYDVPAIMSIPMTLQKLKELSHTPAAQGGAGMINCEDEAYIAAAGGFSMGIMRHPYTGDFINGKADVSFPAFHRNIKSKLTEITRAVRWHRLAPAFGVDGTPFYIDPQELTDTWRFERPEEELEDWWFRKPFIKNCIAEGVLTKTAPARIARGCPPAQVTPDSEGNLPYTLTCSHPNGAFSIVTAGRTADRSYFLPRCAICAQSGAATTIGIFGCYETLTLQTDFSAIKEVWMQDLADDAAYDITDVVPFEQGNLTLSGSLIQKIGTSAQPEGDTSEPGVVVFIKTP